MHEAKTAYDLEDFVRDLTDVVERTPDDAGRVLAAERLLGNLIADSSWLGPEKRRPAGDGYARHALYRDPKDRFEVIALVWQPGQKTPLHDHDGTWGAEGVIAGQMRVTNFVQAGELPGDRIQLRNAGTIIVNQGNTGQLLPPADCHILESCGPETAITIHVYGHQLQQFRVFAETAEPGIYTTHLHQVSYTS